MGHYTMPQGKLDSGRVYKVALFGVTGCGKSSIVNLLAGEPVVEVSTGVEACTKRAQWFPISIGEKRFWLWDTMGFNQTEAKDVNQLSPYEQAHTLLQNLQDGIDLILLCARKDGINSSLRDLYWLLDSFFFRGRAQIALVLTHFDEPDEDWWDRNVHILAQRCNILVQFLPYVCVTTIRSESTQPDPAYEQSKQALRALLQKYAISSIRLSDLSSGTPIEGVAEYLSAHCQLSILNAKTLVERFMSPRRPFHAILFGDACVGKSSVINLIAGESVASVSSRLESCTLSSSCYEVNTGLHQFLVWDTVGFNGRYEGKDATEMALRNAAHLVRDLHGKGGVDLLVFCRKGDRLSSAELNSFRLFQEFLCEGQIPVAFIITHLESHDPMEKWWEENGEALVKNCVLRMSAVAGHACITAAHSDPKRLLSRKLVLAMLEDSVSGNAFSRDEGNWATSFWKRFEGMAKGSSSKKSISITKLMDRCGLTKKQANELIKLLNSRSPKSPDSISL